MSEVSVFFLVVGLPCAGKTTYIRRNFPQSADTEVFDEKELRTLGRILRYMKAAAWEKKKTVVVEGVFCKDRDRRKLIEWAYDNNYIPKCVVIDTELDVCLARNKARDPDLRVSPGSIRRIFSGIKIPSIYEGFASVKREYGNGQEDVHAFRRC